VLSGFDNLDAEGGLSIYVWNTLFCTHDDLGY
jgi:hypothetical protein